MASEAPRSRPSLKDIARRVSVAPQAPAKAADTVRPVSLSTPPVPADHPALRDLAEICERSLQEGVRAPSLAPVMDAVGVRKASVPPARKTSKWATVAPIAGGALIAVAAIATSAVMLTRPPRTVAGPQPVVAVATAVPQQVAAPVQVDPGVANPSPLGQHEAPAPGMHEHVPARADGPRAVSPSQPNAAAPVPTVAASTAAVEEKAEAQRPGDLPSAMAAAVTADAPQEPAKSAPAPASAPDDGSIPETPSQGAIQAALSSVRESARSCVVGMDEASRATVSFSSNGTVARVSVSGPAAGKGAEACIRAALSGAKVAPFRKPSFSVGLSLRP